MRKKSMNKRTICYMANLQFKRMPSDVTSIRWMLHLNCYTHGGLHMRRVITKQLMYGFCPRVLFLSTRPEACAYKSNVTCRAIH